MAKIPYTHRIDGSREPVVTKGKAALSLLAQRLGFADEREALAALYEKHSAVEIGKMLSVARMTVFALLDAYGIPKRSRGGPDAPRRISIADRREAEESGTEPVPPERFSKTLELPQLPGPRPLVPKKEKL